MDFIGFDLGKISSQVCVITEDGELNDRPFGKSPEIGFCANTFKT